MTVFHRARVALTRPRGPVSHRFYRVGRSSRGGVALLMVLSAILLLTILVTEIAHGAAVRVQLAAHHRDEVKAEALAHTGLELYRLILMTSKQFEKMLRPYIAEFGGMMGLNADTLWSMVPFINTQLLRMIFVTDGDIETEDIEEVKENQGLSDEQVAESREDLGIKRNFLDFDGDFSARVEDESRYIYVGSFPGVVAYSDLLASPTLAKVAGLAAREEYRSWFLDNQIEVNELVGNLVDWTDLDNSRIYQGGDEDALYQSVEPRYRARNAPFDTLEELRLVDGWNRDGVWQRLGQHLTIYGEGKVNINTAGRPVIRALFVALHEGGPPNDAYVDERVDEFMRLRSLPVIEGGVFFAGATHFVTYVENQLAYPLRDDAANFVTTTAGVFRVVSSGEVGDARVQVTAVLDFRTDPMGRLLYYKVE
ncbi:MAG: general secretion pathway protein GspK [Deltaproteobacteria bacterium]|nr:general secretion pathway protein GspK [Deltaproteobacteria bacterium]